MFGMFKDILKMVQDGKDFLGNVHLEINDMYFIKDKLEHVGTTLLYGEMTNADTLKKIPHFTLLIGQTRKALNMAYQALDLQNNIVNKQLFFDSMSQLSNRLSQLLGLSEECGSIKEMVEKLRDENVPQSQVSADNPWRE